MVESKAAVALNQLHGRGHESQQLSGHQVLWPNHRFITALAHPTKAHSASFQPLSPLDPPSSLVALTLFRDQPSHLTKPKEASLLLILHQVASLLRCYAIVREILFCL